MVTGPPTENVRKDLHEHTNKQICHYLTILHVRHTDKVCLGAICWNFWNLAKLFKPQNIPPVSKILVREQHTLAMDYDHQPDQIIAIYQFLSPNENNVFAESTTSEPFPDSSTSDQETIDASATSPSLSSTTPSSGTNRKDIITIYEPQRKIPNAKNFTHIAHIVLGNWTANFLCNYDAPMGILHNAIVADMNDEMRKATGWSPKQDVKEATVKQQMEKYRALVNYGIYIKPRSKTVGLCTLKEKDDFEWHYLELRTRGGSGVVEAKDVEGAKMEMVSSVAKKVAHGELSSGAILLSIEDDEHESEEGRDKKGKGKDRADDLEYRNSFAEYLDSLKSHIDALHDVPGRH